MKKLLLVVALAALVGLAPCAYAAQFAFHGDMDHRFQVYNDQQNFFKNDNLSASTLDGATAQYGEFKYRLWTEAATDDNAVKGVFAVEIGAIKYGDSSKTFDGGTGIGGSSKGGGYSGDGITIETRWAYTDFMLGNGRLKVGLQPWAVNPYLWVETATAVQYNASAGSVDYTIGWARGKQYLSDDKDDAFIEDSDALLGRVNFGIGQGSKAGAFVLYQKANPSTPGGGTLESDDYQVKKFSDLDYSIWTLGVDGKVKTSGPLFIAWDLMYQNGNIDNVEYTELGTGLGTAADTDVDLSAYFAHLDVGVKLGKTTITFTSYYASGDDDPTDDDFDAFLTTDLDRADSIVFQEAGYTSDNYFTERSTFADKGLWLNKLAADFQVNDKTKVGAAVLYLMTTEDVEYTDDNGVAQSETDLGIELDAYIAYKMYKNLTLALNAGYLFAGDAMDIFETTTDGSSDENIFRSTARIRYQF